LARRSPAVGAPRPLSRPPQIPIVSRTKAQRWEVITQLTVSLERFVTGPNNGRDPPLGEGAIAMSTVTVSLAAGAERSRSMNWGRFSLVGLGTIFAAIGANVLVYYAGRAIVGYEPQFTILADVGTTIFFTAIPAIGATLIYAALLRFARLPARLFALIAAIVFVVTTVPDFTYIPGVPGATTGQTAILVLMHIVAATVITGLLLRFARPVTR
jgi:hypothetical protein